MATQLPDADASLPISSWARFFDADSDLKNKTLSPIRQYEKWSLVSLDEAVCPLKNLIDDLQTDIWVAKQNTEEHGTDHLLTKDERAILHLYTMQPLVSHLLNEALRNDNREYLLPWFSFLKLFLTALWKLNAVERTVWRGAKGNCGAELRKRQKFVWWGVSSCTSSREILDKNEFIGNIEARTLFQIECFNGRDIRQYSHSENEEEYLLLPCSYFEVLSVIDERDDLCIVHVRQQEPPVSLIQPPFVSDPTIETTSDEREESKVVAEAPIQQLSRNQRRRQKQKARKRVDAMNTKTTSTVENVHNHSTEIVAQASSCMRLDTSNEPNKSTEQMISTQLNPSNEPSTETIPAAATLNFNQLTAKPIKSITAMKNIRMTANDQYFLVCPERQLCLLDKDGNEYWSINRTFDVDDICYSSYLKQFLILADYNLYSLDLQRPTKLELEISNFARDMDECTCYENLFLVIKDFGGATVEVWDMKSTWKLHKRYEQPISCRRGQGICTIRFSTDGNHLGVTLIEPFRAKAFFQLRNSDDMKILKITELPFYEGYCNHYILSLPQNEFLVYKYSEQLIFWFDSHGQRKQIIQYNKGICTMALIDHCFAIQTKGPDKLHFYNL